MKQFILAFYFLFISIVVFSQAPNAFNYQAAVRNSSGEIIANQSVSFRISILQGSATGIEVYSETHSVATNNFGLANLKIGEGERKSGIFSQIGWGVNSHYVKIEIDINGGNSFVHMGTSQLLSVPYAIHAQTAENTFSGNYNDLSNKPVANQWTNVNNGIEYSEGIVNVANINLNNSSEIFFKENGQISSHDNNHRILFRRTENIFEIREWGDIIFSSGSSEGAETNTMNIQSGGNVGIGIEEPTVKLEVDGTIYSRSKGFKFPDGTVQTTAAVGSGGDTADNWGTQVVEHNNTLSGFGTVSNPLEVNESTIQVDWENIQNMPSGFADNIDNSSIANGSETKIIAGTNITVTGSGTTVNPYVITAGSDASGLSIGDTYAGGIIFYLDASGRHGLVAASTDFAATYKWQIGEHRNSIAFANGVSAGFGNTRKIVLDQDGEITAARRCYDFDSGYTDWYLPSLYELDLMYSNIGWGATGANENIGNFSGLSYWSSNDSGSIHAWIVNGGSGNHFVVKKDVKFRVRPVRMF